VVPQFRQNRASGAALVPQAAQARGPRADPQLLQNFPEAAAPQLGQDVATGSDTASPDGEKRPQYREIRQQRSDL
jgi:hypothetical protein